MLTEKYTRIYFLEMTNLENNLKKIKNVQKHIKVEESNIFI